jgi:SAM-dependent methyltransferase
MEALLQLKRFLREHPHSRKLYAVFGDKWTRSKIAVRELTFGRYHTAARFDRLFLTAPDPWSYGSSPISTKRRQLILDTLPRRQYERLLELGCAEGWMTGLLALRAYELVAADISVVALARARDRCRHQNVHFIQIDLIEKFVPGVFDGIVCAGVLPFLPMNSQQVICNRIIAALEPDGHLLLEHIKNAYPGELAGDKIHELYRNNAKLVVISDLEVDNYIITLFRKIGA